jgi:5,10-methenyltetrahydromethanopterin hydrogenase
VGKYWSEHWHSNTLKRKVGYDTIDKSLNNISQVAIVAKSVPNPKTHKYEIYQNSRTDSLLLKHLYPPQIFYRQKRPNMDWKLGLKRKTIAG